MKTFNTEELIMHLIGQVNPIADSTEDSNRYDNLVELCDLVDNLLYKINEVKSYKNSEYASMYEAGKYAEKRLNDWLEELNTEI